MPESMKSLPSSTSPTGSHKAKSRSSARPGARPRVPMFHYEIEDAQGVGGKSHCGCSLDGLSDAHPSTRGDANHPMAFPPGNYLVVREDHIGLINCVPCLQGMLDHASRDYLAAVREGVKEGEAKAHAQNECDRYRAQVETLYTKTLSQTAQIFQMSARVDSANEDLHAYISMVRAKGEVRAAFDPVYRLYRDAKIENGNLTPTLRAKMLSESLPGDRKAMEAILKEDEHGQYVASLSLHRSRLDRVPAPLVAGPLTGVKVAG